MSKNEEEIMEVDTRGNLRHYRKLPFDENRNCRMVLIESDFNNLTTKTWHLEPAPDMPTGDSWKKRFIDQSRTVYARIDNLHHENIIKTERIKTLEAVIARMTIEVENHKSQEVLANGIITRLKQRIERACQELSK